MRTNQFLLQLDNFMIKLKPKKCKSNSSIKKASSNRKMLKCMTMVMKRDLISLTPNRCISCNQLTLLTNKGSRVKEKHIKILMARNVLILLQLQGHFQEIAREIQSSNKRMKEAQNINNEIEELKRIRIIIKAQSSRILWDQYSMTS